MCCRLHHQWNQNIDGGARFSAPIFLDDGESGSFRTDFEVNFQCCLQRKQPRGRHIFSIFCVGLLIAWFAFVRQRNSGKVIIGVLLRIPSATPQAETLLVA